MVVKTSKKMYEVLKKVLKENERTKDYELVFNQMNSTEYSFNIGSFNYNDYLDYNERTGKYNVFTVIYPDNYYACDRHISSDLLLDAFRNSKKTFDSFVESLIDLIEI